MNAVREQGIFKEDTRQPVSLQDIILPFKINPVENDQVQIEQHEEEEPDSRDLGLAEFLDYYHPRGMESGANYGRPPLIKEFIKSLPEEDWKSVHMKVLRLGIAIISQTRIRYQRKRNEMDGFNVFNSEANKIRTGAQMQVELKRELKYPKLELLILEELAEKNRQESITSKEKDTMEIFASLNKITPLKTPINKPQPQMEMEEKTDKLLNFQEYCEARRTDLNSNNRTSSICVPVEEYMKARALGFRGGDLKFRKTRKSAPIGFNSGKSSVFQNKKQKERKINQINVVEYESDVESEDEISSDSGSEVAVPKNRIIFRNKKDPEEELELLQTINIIFDRLAVPAVQRLDFLIKYSNPENVLLLVDVVFDWKQACDIILLHEHVLDCQRLAEAKQLDSSEAFSDEQVVALEQLNCYITMAQMFGSPCVAWIGAILKKLSVVCEKSVRCLDSKWGDILTYRGQVYTKVRFSRCENNKNYKRIAYGGNSTILRYNKVLLLE